MRHIGNIIAPARFIMFLIVSAGGAAALWLAGYDWHYALMAGFDGGALVFLGSLWRLVKGGDSDNIARHARENDANRVLMLVISAVVGLVILVTVKAQLSQPGEPQAALIIGTLAIAWLYANTIYALHYAHLFYGEHHAGGLEFPGTSTPDYLDFFYFSFTLGMTFQTADVSILSRTIRRVALAQSISAFIFNIGILAFTINTLGSG